jgi:Swi5-dependent recombination DNA repair protein 1
MSNLAHAAKRRRLNDAASTLSKPFKSPFKANLKATKDEEDDEEKPEPAQLKPKEQTNDSESPAVSTEVRAQPKAPASPTDTNKNFSSPLPKHSSPANRSTTIPSSLLNTYTDSELSALQKQHTRLLNQLSKLRQDLDAARQALRIESSDSDADLEALIVKWRRASREAAEEVFKGARDRVNRMGGMKGMREREKWRREWEREGEEEDRRKVMDETGVGDEVEDEREDVREAKVEEDEVSRRSKHWAYETRDDVTSGWIVLTLLVSIGQTFTMDMMLKGLNVELDVIGYDKENQRWIDSE